MLAIELYNEGEWAYSCFSFVDENAHLLQSHLSKLPSYHRIICVYQPAQMSNVLTRHRAT